MTQPEPFLSGRDGYRGARAPLVGNVAPTTGVVTPSHARVACAPQPSRTRLRGVPAFLATIAVDGALAVLDEEIAEIQALVRAHGMRAAAPFAQRARRAFEARLRMTLSDPGELARMSAQERRIHELTLIELDALALLHQHKIRNRRALINLLAGDVRVLDVASRARCATWTVRRWCAGRRTRPEVAGRIVSALLEVWEGLSDAPPGRNCAPL